MNNEIKEMNLSEMLFNRDERLLDCITNLQEEVEDLREDNYAYHQLMKMQNKREYRSKFLKEFQEEFGTNVFPDYDEIYKRYDKVKKENEKLKKALCKDNIVPKSKYDYLKRQKEGLELNLSCIKDYKQRNEKAIEYITSEESINIFTSINAREKWLKINHKLLNILNGGDEE